MYIYITMTWGWCEAGGGTGSNSTATKQKIILKIKNVDVYNRNQLFFFFLFPFHLFIFLKRGVCWVCFLLPSAAKWWNFPLTIHTEPPSPPCHLPRLPPPPHSESSKSFDCLTCVICDIEMEIYRKEEAEIWKLTRNGRGDIYNTYKTHTQKHVNIFIEYQMQHLLMLFHCASKKHKSFETV